jgi:tryptophan synthase alpha chain
MNGIQHIQDTFQQSELENRAALMPYFTLGYPDPQTSMKIITRLAECGADILELGIPFSDPIADGTTIQYSTQVALSHGMNIERCFSMVRELRQAGINQPILLMGYYNPVVKYGVNRFVDLAFSSGVDGFIIPDLPPEEAEDMELNCERHQLALIYMIAPTTTPERAKYISQKAKGFLYLVSLKGVTGARSQIPDSVEPLIQKTKAITPVPIAVGFGISTQEQARQIASHADGVIVGSALINEVIHSPEPVKAAGEKMIALRAAMVRS